MQLAAATPWKQPGRAPARRRAHRLFACRPAALAVWIAAAGLPAVCTAQVAPTRLASPGQTGWQTSASIYVYLPSVSGSSSFPADSGGSTINLSGDQILDKLDFAAMGTLGFHNGSFGVFLDGVYLRFEGGRSNSRDFSFGNVGLPASTSASLDWNLRGWVWTLAGEYRLAAAPAWTIDLVAGARRLKVEQTLRWNISGSLGPLDPLARSGESTVEESAWDAIVGVKGRWGFGDRLQWSVPFYLDAGTGQSSSTVQAAAGLAYAFKWGELTTMWRYLGYNTKAGKRLEDFEFSGPLFAASWRW